MFAVARATEVDPVSFHVGLFLLLVIWFMVLVSDAGKCRNCSYRPSGVVVLATYEGYRTKVIVRRLSYEGYRTKVIVLLVGRLTAPADRDGVSDG
jgi:hypothetical protein